MPLVGEVVKAPHYFDSDVTRECTIAVRHLLSRSNCRWHGSRCYTDFIVFLEAIMLDPKFFEEISAGISRALAATPAADIEKNLRAMLTAQFTKLDLVTRTDFDIQKELLTRAQARLAQLEARLAELEARK